MAFEDPQVLDIGNIYTLRRTGMGMGVGSFEDPASQLKLEISHSYGKRYRHLVKFTLKSYQPDPINPAVNMLVSASAHLVIDEPSTGALDSDLKFLSDCVVEWLQSNPVGGSDEVNSVRFIGGEA